MSKFNPLRWVLTGVLLGKDSDGNAYELGYTAVNDADPDTTWVIDSEGNKHEGYEPNQLN